MKCGEFFQFVSIFLVCWVRTNPSISVYISEMRYYVHYLHFLDYCPHLCRHVYHNVSDVVHCLTFQPPKEGQSVQQPKRCDKHGDKDEDNSPKNVNNVHNTSSLKYRQIMWWICFERSHSWGGWHKIAYKLFFQ